VAQRDDDRVSAKVELFDATTLRFSRNTIATGSDICRWYVLSHPNISVQRGSAATAAAGDLTVAQTFAGVDTSLSFLETTNDDSLDTATFPRPYWRASFTASNALQWQRYRSNSSANFRWQVVSLVSEIAPSAVTNLSALVGAQPGQVDLSWTSPGDDANSGTLAAGSQYRVQYTTDEASAGQAGFFSTASAQVLLSTVGVVPGSLRRYGLDGLWNNTTHYLRLWTRDEANIYSGLSNGATVATRA
ncbi:MAG: fibronectin type III domain-containing protein, partial [Elusimicrobia bacterium]|nr:fibronectin type III domain-containing protein [Elusimicrobiota bacterium]